MQTDARNLKIFVSSPGDVAEERRIAQRVLKRLTDRFSRVVRIDPIFWEHEPLVATQSFQEGIPSPAETDIVVCILWARFGTRLPPEIRRHDGTTYASGTEYEFEAAVEGQRLNDGRPDLLVYRKMAQPDPKSKSPKELLAFAEQWQALDTFVTKWFHGADGILVAAFHPFEEPAGFEQILEVHLSKLIGRRLDAWGLKDEASLPAPATWSAGSPFRGLNVFEFEHAPIFFGRTRAVSEVLTALRRQADASRAFLLVLGGSGCGKSSLVRAGVLPMLTQPGVIEGIGLWRRAVMRPGAVSAALTPVSGTSPDLFDGLAAALTDPAALPELLADGTSLVQLTQMLRKNPAGALGLVKGALSQAAVEIKAAQETGKQPEARLVLLIDQLEEIFSDKRFTADNRRALFVAISKLAHSGKVWVIATLRNDFYESCQDIPELDALKGAEGQFDLSQPAPVEIGQMIRQPASAAGLQFGPDPQTGQTLDDALQNDAAEIKEGLPLLEFALDELYRHAVASAADGSASASPVMLRFEDYFSMNRLAGCLAACAEQTFQELDAAARAAFAKVFRKMVALDNGDRTPTRRIAPRSEFQHDPAIEQFVERFVAARLFTADKAIGPDARPTVRIAHEALLTTAQWDRLRQWLADDRDNLQMHARLAAAAKRWDDAEQSTSLLLQPGKPLDEARQLLAAQFELSDLDQALIEASQRQAKLVRFVQRAAISALGVLTVLAIVFGTIAQFQRRAANAARLQIGKSLELQTEARKDADTKTIALRAQLRRLALSYIDLADADNSVGRNRTGLHWLLLAYRTFRDAAGPEQSANDPLPDGIRHLLSGWRPSAGRVLIHERPVRVAKFNPDGRTVLTIHDGDKVQLWSAATGKPIGQLLRNVGSVDALTFSRDGRKVLTSSGATARLWDAATGKPIGQPLNHGDWVTSLAFSPDGGTLVAGTGLNDGSAHLWDTTTGKPFGPSLRHGGAITVVSFSPDGRTILTANSFTTAALWDAATGKLIGQPLRHKSSIYSASFSPDGKTILTGSFDNTARLWDAATGKPIGQPLRHKREVHAVAFNPDGRTVATASDDNTAQLWDAVTGAPIGQPMRQDGHVTAVSFSPDGCAVLTGSEDGTARLWDATAGEPIGRLRHLLPILAMSLSSDGRTVATGSDNIAQLWEVATGKRIGQPLPHNGHVTAVQFAPDGRTILTVCSDKTAKLWEVATGKRIGQALRHDDDIRAVAFSADGRTVLTGSIDKTARLWEAATGNPIGQPLRHDDFVNLVAFSPDRRTFLTGSNDTVRLWGAATGKPSGEPLRHKWTVNAVALSPDGLMVLTGSSDQTARLWETATGRPIGQPLRHAGAVNAVAFSPNGLTVLTGSSDHTARLWETATGKPIGQPLRHEQEVIAASFSPDGLTILTAIREEDTVHLWEVATGKPIGEPLRPQRPAPEPALSPDGSPVLEEAVFSPDGCSILTRTDSVCRWNFPKPAADNPERIQLWIETLTGFYRNEQLRLQPLSIDQLTNRFKRLDELGGSLDPVINITRWHCTQASESEHAKNWFAAAFHWQCLISAHPNLAEYRLGRSNALLQLKRFADARLDLDQALACEPTNVELYRSRARALLGLSDYPRALVDATRVIELALVTRMPSVSAVISARNSAIRIVRQSILQRLFRSLQLQQRSALWRQRNLTVVMNVNSATRAVRCSKCTASRGG